MVVVDAVFLVMIVVGGGGDGRGGSGGGGDCDVLGDDECGGGGGGSGGDSGCSILPCVLSCTHAHSRRLHTLPAYLMSMAALQHVQSGDREGHTIQLQLLFMT
jgi:hypothetical protein